MTRVKVQCVIKIKTQFVSRVKPQSVNKVRVPSGTGIKAQCVTGTPSSAWIRGQSVGGIRTQQGLELLGQWGSSKPAVSSGLMSLFSAV